MKIKLFLVLTSLLVMTLAVTAGTDEDSWFDMENCALCQNLMAEEGLIENMKMDNYVIATGWMVVAQIPEEYKAAHANAKKNMEKTVQKMMGGEEMHICNFCTSYGALMMAGAQMESFESGGAEISLATSTDPAVIKQIQKHAKRTAKEVAAMHGDGHGEHDGHGH
jgi:hypothetical protein